ncbi:MAG: type III-B CRISPR module-associated protein Cmr5 [Candidatus Marinimicrobia bacterium]|nr:type III-B CRISPR module-associated protein Cmr5 [Candidatus Neomarinimicrobiota bacterium]
MNEKETLIHKLERGRAEFAYKCAKDGKKIKEITQIENEWFKDDKYASYVKKIPQMILSNGLGQTLAFIISKKQKQKENRPPGSKENPKNAYDLIYKQLTEYMKSNHTSRISMPHNESDLIKWVISCNSTDYRYITQELLALLGWLKRFVEGLIEEEN